jgi:hypothetical protein
LHACKSIETKIPEDEHLSRLIGMVRRNLESPA